jgi:CP family cyanate transporter-like MFS transporter
VSSAPGVATGRGRILILGSAPRLAFAIAGLVTPRLSRRIGPEHALILGVALLAVGQLLHALSPATIVLIVASVVAFLGGGIGNVLLPPLVRRHFPGWIGLVTGAYVTVQSIGATVAPLLAVPAGCGARRRRGR